MTADVDTFALQIWNDKYRFRAADGSPIDQSLDDTFRRVAKALAVNEADAAAWEDRFYKVMHAGVAYPAGRILSGAGTGRSVTLFNCFIADRIGDSMNDIMDVSKETVMTMRMGGGVGHDFSTLRPAGALVRSMGSKSSGPVSFMSIFDTNCQTVSSAGERRGAMMGTMRIDHPDIGAFIDAKREKGRLTNFNLSVLVTDAFMRAVSSDADWPLVFGGKTYRVVKARALWDKIMRATYDYAEPGVIFIDTVQGQNPLAYCEEIIATNPCGEVPGPANGVCCLGPINFARLIEHPFTADARLNVRMLKRAAAVLVRALDNVIDISLYPLPKQKEESLAKRRIGVGAMGVADALMMMQLRYGSAEAVSMFDAWMHDFQRAVYEASIDLAKEKGSFPAFDADKYLSTPHGQSLPADIQAGIRRFGLRNGVLTSMAPTGTVSNLAGSVSGGIEPHFAMQFTRRVRQPDDSTVEVELEPYAVRLFRETFGAAVPLPPYFVGALDLTSEEHLAMQAVAQRYTDSAVSKTVNLPASMSYEDFQGVYLRAYEMGCKGITTYRPSETRGAVLVVKDDEAATAPAQVVPLRPAERPEALPGVVYKRTFPDSDHAMYVTITDSVDARGKRRPTEVFVNTKSAEHFEWTTALTRMISALLRRGDDVSFVVEELMAVFSPMGGHWHKGEMVPSRPAAIGQILKQHMIEIGFFDEPEPEAKPVDGNVVSIAQAREAAGGQVRQCPKCGAAMARESGCDTCHHCGHSKCG